jgi:integrase
LRIGELLALRWTDVDLERGVMRVGRTHSRAKGGPRFTTAKNGKGRPVTLTRQATETLRSHRKSQNELRLEVRYGRLRPRNRSPAIRLIYTDRMT